MRAKWPSASCCVAPGGKLRLRQVTRLKENGHQTPILTNREDLPAAQIAYRMFNRWKQEIFFKYLGEEYALDALAEYAAVPDDPLREVPNPAWAAVDARLAKGSPPEFVYRPALAVWEETHVLPAVERSILESFRGR